jgi:hypothetical protein
MVLSDLTVNDPVAQPQGAIVKTLGPEISILSIVFAAAERHKRTAHRMLTIRPHQLSMAAGTRLVTDVAHLRADVAIRRCNGQSRVAESMARRGGR